MTAFIGGLVNGMLGTGVGSIMVMGMLFIGVSQPVASATSGYQIMFTGAASMIQALANN